MPDLMPDLPTGPLIAVTAVGHPQRDAWVDQKAAEWAAREGVTLGTYLGRERDVYPNQPAGICCHLYAVADDGSAT